MPVHDDRLLFEFLILEGAQAGLSWITILRKRAAYRTAFAGFDAAKVARFGARDVRRLLADPGIVRNRLKIDGGDRQRARRARRARASTAASIASSGSSSTAGRSAIAGRRARRGAGRDRRLAGDEQGAARRGFRFVGPTICYAFMQATGMVNDHLVDCFRHRQLARRR